MALEIRYWRQVERHPLSAEYPNITGPGWDAFIADFKEFGNIDNRPIYLLDGKIVDGYQLYRAYLECDQKPTFKPMPKLDAELFVRIKNDNRRDENWQSKAIRAEARRARVETARQEGESLRAIAEQENVSESQIRRDLSESAAPPAQVTTGLDGKSYPATQPKLIPDLARMQLSPRIIPVLESLSKTKQAKVVELIVNGQNVRNALKAVTEPPPEQQREPGDDKEQDAERAAIAELKDAEGIPVPSHIAPAFGTAKEIESLCRDIGAMIRTVELLAKAPGGRMLHAETLVHALKEVKGSLWANRATHICPYCKGKSKKRDKDTPCEVCKGEGWVPKHIYADAPK